MAHVIGRRRADAGQEAIVGAGYGEGLECIGVLAVERTLCPVGEVYLEDGVCVCQRRDGEDGGGGELHIEIGTWR